MVRFNRLVYRRDMCWSNTDKSYPAGYRVKDFEVALISIWIKDFDIIYHVYHIYYVKTLQTIEQEFNVYFALIAGIFSNSLLYNGYIYIFSMD